MEATTRCKSSRDAVFFDEQFDGSTEADAVTTAGPLVEDVVEGRFEGIVVEFSRIPPPEAPGGVVEGVEGFDEAFEVDERVADEFV